MTHPRRGSEEDLTGDQREQWMMSASSGGAGGTGRRLRRPWDDRQDCECGFLWHFPRGKDEVLNAWARTRRIHALVKRPAALGCRPVSDEQSFPTRR